MTSEIAAVSSSSTTHERGIEIRNLSFTHDRPRKTPVLCEFRCGFPPGTLCVLLGRSGCGKSTLLKLVLGMLKPTTPQSEIKIASISPDVAREKRLLGYLPQESNPAPWRTVLSNLCLPLELLGDEGRDVDAMAGACLAHLKFQQLKDRYPTELSGGQRRKLAIGMCVVTQPTFLFLDEPFSGLDAVTKLELYRFLMELVKEKNELWKGRSENKARTTLLVTHDIEEAAILGDTLYLMGSGTASQLTRIDNTIKTRGDFENVRYTQQFADFVRSVRQALETN